MCGIAALFSLNSKQIDKRSSILQMIAAVRHRGPDAWGIYTSSQVALGHVRLSILDLEGGYQPMETEHFTITFNGEIYNHVELRAELKKNGAVFRTKSDTEVILKAFEAYGTSAIPLLNGQFAFIIWDKTEKRIIAVRDRYGICPLYYLQHQGVLYFSSEMKAFDSIDGFNRLFDPEHLLEHALLWNTLGDETVYKNIKSLPPGTFEVFKNPLESTRQRYYEIGESNLDPKPENLGEAIEELRFLLDDAVKLRLRSDVPVAAYLSGGIDSSVVTHITQRISNQRLHTFGVGFTDKEFDESAYQKEMALYAGTNHHQITCDYKTLNDHFLDAMYHFERPVFRTAGIPLFLLSNSVRDNNVKVVLTGEGGDEILYGYDSYKEIKLLDFWRRNPSSRLRPLLLKKLYPHLMHYNNPKQFGLIRMYYEGFLKENTRELGGLNIRVHNNQVILNFFNKDHGLEFSKEKLINRIKSILPDNFHNWTPLQQNQFLEMKTLLSGYLLSSQADRMSMAHGVEGRYPFLDHRVVDRLFYFPDNFKLNGFLQKFLLSEAYKGEIPESITKRPKKPYTAPDLKSFYYGGKLSEQAAFFLSNGLIKQYGIFDTPSVDRFLKKYERRIPVEIGYRDNMLITFLLSCQMACFWAKNPKTRTLNDNLKKVDIMEE